MSSESDEYVPHAIHTWFGYLKVRGLIVPKEEGAKHGPFTKDTEKRLREALVMYGWVYCVDCRRPIFSIDEALDHIKQGHLLTNEFMHDDVAPEEVPIVS